MPGIREKLVELLKKTPIAEINGHIAEAEACFVSHVFESMVDHLIANGVTIQRWIPVTERLPESGVHVLVCCEIRSGGAVYKRYICDGYYAKRFTEQTWNNSDDIACEYREEDDEYYLLEGWYEVIKNWDDYNSIVISDFVTHWMPLPELPKGE